MNSLPMQLSVVAEAADLLSLKLSGTVTQRHVTDNTDPLDAAVKNGGLARRMLWDLSGVELLDSSGVNWLLNTQRRVRESGGRIVLHSVSPIARNVLRVLNLQTIFAIAENVAEAERLAQGATA